MEKGENIARFLGLRRLAVIGVSRSGQGFGATLYRELAKRRYAVTPVNRDGGSIDGVTMARSVKELKGNIDGIVVVVPPGESIAIVKEAFASGILDVWMAQGADSKEAVAFCRDHQMSALHGECLLMFLAKDVFPHSWHRGFRKFTGRLPRVPNVEFPIP